MGIKGTNEWQSLSLEDIRVLKDKKLSNDKKTKRNFGIILITLTMLFAIIQIITGYRFEVLYNNEVIAVADSKSDFYDAFKKVESEYQKKSLHQLKLSEDYILKGAVISKNKVSTPSSLVKAIENNSTVLQNAVSIFVNDKEIVSLDTMDDANEILNKIKSMYSNEENTDIEFFEKVEIKNNYVLEKNVLTQEGALEILLTQSDKSVDYQVKEGDTLWDIAEANNISVEKLVEFNENLGKIYPNQIIKLAVPQYVINVRNTKKVTSNEDIPYATEYKVDDNMFKGDRKVITNGQYGKKKIDLEVVEQNGVEIEKIVLAEEIVSQPKAEIVAIGTKEYANIFRMPAYGSITSRYGFRWGRKHEGIDIAGSIGSSIYAASDGVVSFSGWENGYGKFIIIDHKDGYQTCYGHNKVNLVEVGQKVTKGTKIAEIGVTGNTTGSHVHFEVRSNGAPIDPLKFLQ